MTVPSFVDPLASTRPRHVAAEFVRYFGCSVLALATDLGLFALSLQLGLGYATAAVVGFAAGLWVVYRMSVRFAFSARAVSDERVEFTIFAAIGVCGLLLTEALLWLLIERIGFGPLPAKLITAGFVFCFNFGARKALLFTRHVKAVVA